MKHLNSFKLFESKVYIPSGVNLDEPLQEKNNLVGDIKYDLEYILQDIEDLGFRYQISINDWTKSFKKISDSSEINWLNIKITKDGSWDLEEIDETIIRIVHFMYLNDLTPQFAFDIDIDNMKTSLISPYSDKFKNMLYTISGWHFYDITFINLKNVK